MTRLRTSTKPNGHAGPNGHTNGPVPASTERGGVPVQEDQAASDDARGVPLAMDASSIHAPATACDAYAESAPPPPNGHLHEAPARNPGSEGKTEPIPGGEFPLPADPGEFVEEIHRRADLFEVWQRLLNHTDPKIQQRAIEKVTEMRYKGAAALADEPQQVINDMPGPIRD